MNTAALSQREVQFLREAAKYLEQPSWLMRLADVVGEPLQRLAEKAMPRQVAHVAHTALRKAMEWAAGTVTHTGPDDRALDDALQASNRTDRMHKLATLATGGAGGLFGLPGLAVELPVTTGLMLRSIAAIAADFGEDVSDPAVRLECLGVFSHGAGGSEDAMDSSYLTTRIAMGKLVQDAAAFLAAHTAREVSEAITRGTAPVLVRYLGRIAAEFDVVVAQKVLAQSVPVIGIATGALINAAFTDHFNRVARCHFGIRKLERLHGEQAVQDAYRAVFAASAAAQLRAPPGAVGGLQQG
jgi:hypothetical protein